ncbi:hypothetical protein QYF61_003976 [Mycteria americana]|uniref:Reverse transcriptase domain-containing protein n=1 Tax=Mycteria americana TaxID=33587 RepID=A0AAN7S5R8_MYCAM|nr:hypothetical protein QYF61_003976 [Mycteria americana]
MECAMEIFQYSQIFPSKKPQVYIEYIQVVRVVGGNWLTGRTQRVVVNSSSSNWQPVTSGVPQGSILGPTLFSTFISDLDGGIKRTLMKLADDPKLSGEADNAEGRATLQEDVDRLEEWANKNLMQFNKDKGKVLHLGKHNLGVQHRLGLTQLGSSSVERDPGVLVDNQLNMSEQRAAVAKKANRMLGCTNEGITSRDKAAIIPLYSALVRPHLEYCPHYAKKMWTGWRGSREGPQRCSKDWETCHLRKG